MRLRQDPPPLNTAKPADVAAGDWLEQLRARQDRNDLNVALQKAECRRVLFRVLDQAGVFADPYVNDPMELAYRSGRRSVGLYLLGAIDDVDEHAVMAMRADARARIRQLMIEADSMRTASATQEE